MDATCGNAQMSNLPQYYCALRWNSGLTRLMFVHATEEMSAFESGQMSAVETGQMSAAETGQMSAVEHSAPVFLSGKCRDSGRSFRRF